MKHFIFFIAFLFFFIPVVLAQPFADEIKEFKKQDSIRFPPSNANLFIGSSSFRVWKKMEEDFPGYPVINRGFGGSSLPDLIRYAKDIIFPYHPGQVIIYCGDNDLASSDTISAQTVADRFEQLFILIRSRMPKVTIVFVSIKPSPSRQHLMPKMELANRMIRSFLQAKRKTKYVDVYSLMLDAKGQPEKDLFVTDMLHMNSKGYAIWQKAIQPVLKK